MSTNEWTRDDLPTISAIAPIAADPKSYAYFAVSIALDAVVDHLNVEHPKPEPDRLRRAHAIVEQERDQARHERDMWKDSAEYAAAERDEWRERAEKAEAQAPDPVEEKARDLWWIAREEEETCLWAQAGGRDQERYRRMAAHVLGQEDKRWP